MGQHAVIVPNAALIAICSIVQGQSNGRCAALRRTGEAGNRAVRHRDGVQNAVITALEVCAQYGVNIAVQSVI